MTEAMKHIKTYLQSIAAAALMLSAASACDNTDYSEKSPFDNSAYLNVAESRNSETLTFNRRVTAQVKTFNVKLAYPAPGAVTANIAVDPSLTATFNAKNGTDYQPLPPEFYSLSADAVTIPAGKTTSEDVTISFNSLDQLEIDATYICPVAISTAQGVDVMEGSRTMYWLLRRSSAITTAINLKNVYVTVPGFDKGSPTADVVNNLSAVTMECIVRVNNFDNDISSIMGIEQYFMMRFGDTNFERQQLQTQTTFGKFPESSKAKNLKAGQWYHVALTWDIPSQTICFYVDGELQSISTKHGKSDITAINLGDKAPDDEFGNGGDYNFYFGRSYGESEDPSRMLDGEICEARIWSEARTLEQIRSMMYDIPDPANQPTLCAYWKFDEGTGTVIEDKSGHGNPAKVVPYWKTAAHLETYSKTDAELWPSGIEVPKLTWE